MSKGNLVTSSATSVVPKLVALCVFLASSASCGTHDDALDGNIDESSSDGVLPEGKSRYSIKLYVADEGGEYQLRELSPLNAAYELQQRESAEGVASRADESDSGQEDSLSDADSKRFSKKKQPLA